MGNVKRSLSETLFFKIARALAAERLAIEEASCRALGEGTDEIRIP
jgi:hypothetical protein